MREVTCESGNVYHLALGPQILESISGSYTKIIPEKIFQKVNEYAKRMNKSSIDLLSTEGGLLELQDMNILTANDGMELVEAQKDHSIEVLKKCVKKMNNQRILMHPYFKEEFPDDDLTKKEKETIFYEEVMPIEDYTEIMNEINTVVFEFRLGMDIEEKSKLLSLVREEEKAKSQIPQSQSSI